MKKANGALLGYGIPTLLKKKKIVDSFHW